MSRHNRSDSFSQALQTPTPTSGRDLRQSFFSSSFGQAVSGASAPDAVVPVPGFGRAPGAAERTPWTTPHRPSGSIATPPPGKWRHPQMDEITRRVNQNRFGSQNASVLFWNVLALLGSIYLPGILSTVGLKLDVQPALLKSVLPDWLSPFWIVITLARAAFTYNIYRATQPLYSTTDEIPDIALTPAQRELLNLAPLSEKSVRVQQQLQRDGKLAEVQTPPRYQTASPASAASSVMGPNRRTPAFAASASTAVRYNGEPTASPTPGSILRATAAARQGSSGGLGDSFSGLRPSILGGGGGGGGQSPHTSPSRRQGRGRVSMGTLPALAGFELPPLSTGSQPGTPFRPGPAESGNWPSGDRRSGKEEHSASGHSKFMYGRLRNSMTGSSSVFSS